MPFCFGKALVRASYRDETSERALVHDPDLPDSEVSEDGPARDDARLQPTLVWGTNGTDSSQSRSPDPSSIRPFVQIGAETRNLADETHILLRYRLRAAALVVSIMLGFAFIRSQFQPEAPHALYRAGSLFVVVASCAVLFSQIRLSLGQLRKIELLVFGAIGLQAIVMVSGQMLQFAARGDVASTTGMSVVNYLIWSLIILIYGIFMPNNRLRAAAILLPAACVPQLLLFVVARQHPTVAEILRMNRAGAPAIMPFVALFAAVYAAHLIHSVRQTAFKAQRFGQYRLKQCLGVGGMGEVYQAEHVLLKRPCAIKLIRPDKVSHPTVLKQFEREVKATASLSHWNTVQVFDYGQTSDGVFYYVMELLPGMSLAELVDKHGPLPAERAVHFLRQTCNALNEAHEIGLIHRDVKPANIFIAKRGGLCDVVKLLDFGLVQQTRIAAVTEADQARIIAGTPFFMSPEQAVGGEVSQRSDLYSLGAVAYVLLTGHPPFPDDNLARAILAHTKTPVTPPSQLQPNIPADLEKIVLKCLEKNPDDRFQIAGELEQALAECSCASHWTQQRAQSWWRDHQFEQVPTPAHGLHLPEVKSHPIPQRS